jgi:hypothetical protein
VLRTLFLSVKTLGAGRYRHLRRGASYSRKCARQLSELLDPFRHLLGNVRSVKYHREGLSRPDEQ